MLQQHRGDAEVWLRSEKLNRVSKRPRLQCHVLTDDMNGWQNARFEAFRILVVRDLRREVLLQHVPWRVSVVCCLGGQERRVELNLRLRAGEEIRESLLVQGLVGTNETLLMKSFVHRELSCLAEGLAAACERAYEGSLARVHDHVLPEVLG